MGINLEAFFIKYEFDKMSRYLDLTKRSLAEEFRTLEEEQESEMKQWFENSEEFEFIIGDFEDKNIELGRDFPKLIFGSFIVAWYSFVEQKLLDICDKRKLQISITAKDDINLGKGIRRARKFLLEAANYEIKESHWQELLNINRLRNFLVHTGYQLISDHFHEPEKPFVVHRTDDGNIIYFRIEESLNTYLQKYSMVEYSWLQLEITPTVEYCEHLVNFGREFFQNLFSDLKTTPN